jgi:hypothetical protein
MGVTVSYCVSNRLPTAFLQKPSLGNYKATVRAVSNVLTSLAGRGVPGCRQNTRQAMHVITWPVRATTVAV